MKMTKNFDDLNDTFNVSDDIVQPEIVEKKIDKINLLLMISKKIMNTLEVICIR